MINALYLRLSESDGDLGIDGKDESNSIENQRLLLQSYLTARNDMDGEVVSEVTMLTQQHLDDDKISFDAVDDFIEAVYVYGPEKVEIVFRFEDQLQILKDKEPVCQKAV